MTYRPNCPDCGEPCAIPQDFDDTDRTIRQPWCQNDECDNHGQAVEVEMAEFDTIREREDFYRD